MDVGVRIGQYEVVEHIGRGGMADVWSARDTSLGRMVAIKTIAPDLSIDGDPLSLFEQEARTIANLEHPHILPIYGFGKFQGKLYIVMRYVTGGSLEDVLGESTISFDYALQVARSLGDALQHAHSEKVIHLDLKPPNVLMDSKGVPYLADFGLATALGADGRAKNPGAGTLLYMAPEQLTSDRLDHHADIYSFSLVVFHMLTGQLPFNGRTPLAVRQLQQSDRLPSLSSLNVELPDALTEILRQGTALYPDDRYDSVSEMVQHIEEVMGISGGTLEGSVTRGSTYAAASDFLTSFDPETVQKREAEDIYRRAQQAWASGNGRFLLSVTHYMVMSDFYIEADAHGLSVDREGLQVLLRGALEYDYDLDHWWDVQPDTDSRRWVCLHATRSENPAARVRAYHRLSNLPDSDPPKIVTQVAQALALENNEAAALAALDLLGERARFSDPLPGYKDKVLARKTTFVDTVVRDQLQIVATASWRPIAFSSEVDRAIGGLALDGLTDAVRESAARTVGKVRSVAAVEHLLEERRTNAENRRPTAKALAFVLDEVPSLPSVVPIGLRLMAWLRNTGRRLTQEPMQIVWAFAAAVIGGWIGMGQHVYRTFLSPAVFDQQRMLNTFAFGLLFGLFLGVTVVMAKVLPERLRGFWPNWTRLVWSAVSGFYLSQLLWWSYAWWLLNLDSPPTDILVLTGLGTAIGLVVPAMLRMRGWTAALLTLVTTYGVLYLGTTNGLRVYNLGLQPLDIAFPWLRVSGQAPYVNFEMLRFSDASWIFLYFEMHHIYTILLPLVVFVALGTHFPALVQDVREVIARFRTEPDAVADMPKRRTASAPAVATENPPTRRQVAQEMPQVVGGAPTTDFYDYNSSASGESDTKLLDDDKPMDSNTLTLPEDLPEMDHVGWDDDTGALHKAVAASPEDVPVTRDFDDLEELVVPTAQVDMANNEPATDWDAMLSALETGESETSTTTADDDDDDDVDTKPVAPDPPVEQPPTADEIRAGWDALLSELDSAPQPAETSRIEDVVEWDELATEKITDEELKAVQSASAEEPSVVTGSIEEVADWDSLATEKITDEELKAVQSASAEEEPVGTESIEEVADWNSLATEKITDEELKAVQSASADEPPADDWDNITRQLDATEDKDDDTVNDWDNITRQLDALDDRDDDPKD